MIPSSIPVPGGELPIRRQRPSRKIFWWCAGGGLVILLTWFRVCGGLTCAPDHRLLAAAKWGDSTAAASALANGARVSATAGGGLTPLHLAVMSQDLPTLRLLVAAKPPVSVRASAGGGLSVTPLDLAIRVGDTTIVRLVASAGLPLVTDFGVAPFDRAIHAPNAAALVSILLLAGWDPNQPVGAAMLPLESALISEDLDIIRLLLDAGADPDHPSAYSDTLTPRKLAAKIAAERPRPELSALFAKYPRDTRPPLNPSGTPLRP